MKTTMILYSKYLILGCEGLIEKTNTRVRDVLRSTWRVFFEIRQSTRFKDDEYMVYFKSWL